MDKPIIEGTKAPDFTLPGSDKRITVCLTTWENRDPLLLPQGRYPGCTIEAKGLVKSRENFDTMRSWCEPIPWPAMINSSMSPPLVLLSDSDEAVCKLYGVLKEKNMFGKIGVGIERTTFIIDQPVR